MPRDAALPLWGGKVNDIPLGEPCKFLSSVMVLFPFDVGFRRFGVSECAIDGRIRARISFQGTAVAREWRQRREQVLVIGARVDLRAKKSEELGTLAVSGDQASGSHKNCRDSF